MSKAVFFLSRLLLLVCVSVSAEAIADTIFKCKGSDGVVRYQGAKCLRTEDAVSWVAKSSSLVKVAAQGGGSETGSSFLLVRIDAFKAYRLPGWINGMATDMVVDTGASLVAVPSRLAQQLGLQCNSFVAMSTANGVTRNCKSVIHSLRIGQMELPDVEAVVMENLNVVLLGQSALGRLKMEQARGEIRLSTL